MANSPQLTIGLPVRNGIVDIERKFEEILGQTYGDFVIEVSDNASTDETSNICRKYATLDSRISYVRQTENIGALRNFQFVYSRAQTPYFMWVTADDRLAPIAIERLLFLLVADDAAVCAAPKITRIHSDGHESLALGTFPLVGDAEYRLRRYFANPSDNSRIYGVFRTSCLRYLSNIRDMVAWDWLAMALTLQEGNHLESDEVLLTRDIKPANHYYLESSCGFSRAHKYSPLLPLYSDAARLMPPQLWRACRPVVRLLVLEHMLRAIAAHVPETRPITRRLAAAVQKLSARIPVSETRRVDL